MLGIGASVASAAAGVGILRSAFAAAEQSAAFGQTIARIGALTRASTQELGQLRDTAIQAGIATQFSPQQAAEGLSELGVRGFTASESMQGLTGVLDLAAGGNISVADSAQTVGAALRVFGMDASQAGAATDRLLRISNVTALQANDLAISLGNVSRGAGIAQQSLDEMLPAIGLVRNTGVQASVASNAVSSALIFMARNARKFHDVGVEVTDARGNFRPFLDIVRETDVALGSRFTNAADRATHAVELFGRFGVTAFQGVSNQIRNGVRNSEGDIVRGAAAVDFLRQTMQNADGAAREFREQLLDTFAGQQTLLEGTIETLRTVTGGSFARVFRPFVTAITDTLNVFIRVFQSIPEPVQSALAAIVVGIGGILTALGGITAIGFAIGLIVTFGEIVLTTLGVVAVALSPVIAGFVLLAAVTGTLVAAARRNIGGFGDAATSAFNKVKLAFSAVIQLFSDGGFSGAVRDELNSAENQGVRRFAIQVFRIGGRIRSTFEGIVGGATTAFEAGAPAIRALMDAFHELGVSLGFVSESIEGVAGLPTDDARSFGEVIGQVVGRALVFIVDVVRMAVNGFTIMVETGKAIWRTFGPTFSALGDLFLEVGSAVGELFGQFGAMAASGRDGKDSARSLGTTIASVLSPSIFVFTQVLGASLTVLKLVIGTIGTLLHTARIGFGGFIGLITQLQVAWLNLGDHITIAVNGILADVLRLVRGLPSQVQSLLGINVQTVGAAETGLITQQRQARARIRVRNATGDLLAEQAMPASAENASRIQAARSSQNQAVAGMIRELGRQPVNVTSVLQVDAEVLARATQRGERSSKAGGFAPVGPLATED